MDRHPLMDTQEWDSAGLGHRRERDKVSASEELLGGGDSSAKKSSGPRLISVLERLGKPRRERRG